MRTNSNPLRMAASLLVLVLLTGACGLREFVPDEPVVQSFPTTEASTAVNDVAVISPENLYAWNTPALLDGGTLVYSAKQWNNGSLSSVSVWSQPSKSGPATKLVAAGQGEDLAMAHASPKGDRLVFQLSCAIYSTQKTGIGGRMKLPSTGYCDYAPTLNPALQQIVYSSCVANSDCFWKDSNYIWRMNPDGTEMVQLRQGREPTPSPDGKRIAFSYGGDIWIMNNDGSAVTNLTASDAYADTEPAFAPDGRSIAFTRQARNPDNTWSTMDVWRVSLDGSRLTQLTMNPANDYGSYWGEDGYIYFLSQRGALAGSALPRRVWRMRPVE